MFSKVTFHCSFFSFIALRSNVIELAGNSADERCGTVFV